MKAAACEPSPDPLTADPDQRSGVRAAWPSQQSNVSASVLWSWPHVPIKPRRLSAHPNRGRGLGVAACDYPYVRPIRGLYNRPYVTFGPENAAKI